MVAGAIPRLPTGVDFELHEVGEPFFCFDDPGGLAARQGAKRIEVYCRDAFRDKVGVDEISMALLVVCVVVDILKA
jgi:hypothetical protein